jgi:hypothetical protein
MSEPSRSDVIAAIEHPWFRGPLLGALVGLPILGGGGRLSPRHGRVGVALAAAARRRRGAPA